MDTASELQAEPGGHPPSPAFDSFPIVDELLPGFEPIAVDRGETIGVSLWNRTYRINPQGLVEQIDNGERSLLAGPVAITGRIAGDPLALVPSAQDITAESPKKVDIASVLAHGDVGVEVRTSIEYDGAVRTIVDFAAADPVVFQDIAIQIPLVRASCQYLHHVGDFQRGNCGALALPAGDGMVWESAQARQFVTDERDLQFTRLVNTFLPFVWVGDYGGGLCYFAESDEGWRDLDGRSVIELKGAGDRLDLIVHVVMGKATRPRLRIDFGLQATPVKPLPRGWRGWNFSHVGFAGREGLIPDNAGKVVVFAGEGVSMDTQYRNSRHVFHPDRLAEAVAHAHASGYQYAPYTCIDLLSEARPGLSREEVQGMAKEPPSSRQWTHGGGDHTYHNVCNWSPQNLAMVLEMVEELVSEHDVDGIYLDNVFLVGGCLRPGCSYVKEDGRRQPVFKLHMYREFMQKLASIFIRHGKEPLVWTHTSRTAVMPVFSFGTCMMDGEILVVGRFRKDHVDLVTEADGVVKFSSYPLGMPMLWYSDLKYDLYQKLHPSPDMTQEEFVDRFGAAQIAVCLLHDGLFAGIRNKAYITRIEQAKYAFGLAEDDVQFHPYWEEEEAIRAEDENVRVSYYTRDTGVFLVAASFADRALETGLALPAVVQSRLGGEALLQDPITGETVAATDGRVVLRIEPHTARILLSSELSAKPNPS